MGSWTQTLQEAEISIPIKLAGVLKSKMLDIAIKKKHLKAGLKGGDLVIDGALESDIKTEDSTWTLDPKTKTVTITLQKMNGMNWWGAVCKDDPKINAKKVQPENSKLSDL